MKDNNWARLLAYVTGLVNQQLLLQNEYLAAENRILRAHLPTRLRLTDPERSTLAEIGKRLGRKGLKEVARVAQPDTILAWYRRLIAQKFDGSKQRSYPGRPRVAREVTDLIVRMARENSGWGYDRIVGALANLGHVVSDQTVGNVLRRYGIAPRTEAEPEHDLEAVHCSTYGGASRNGLLHGRGADMAWLGYLLCSVLSASGDPACHPGRHHAAPNRRVDEANRPQRD
jgi:Homeodomain-like domain